MGKIVKLFLVVVAATASGVGSWSAYQFHNKANNALLMENIEAMSQSSGEDTSCPQEKWKKCWKNPDSTQPTSNFICKPGKNGQPCPPKKEKIYYFSLDFGWCCNQ